MSEDLTHAELLERLRTAEDALESIQRGDADAIVVTTPDGLRVFTLEGAETFYLHSFGCRLALDDFGAGFGSFYYLKHLPFDDVKIDGEFVRNSVNDQRDRSIITAMVSVAGAMGRRTVAESIEDEPTLELMRRHGVDLAQGYWLGRPEPISAG